MVEHPCISSEAHAPIALFVEMVTYDWMITQNPSHRPLTASEPQNHQEPASSQRRYLQQLQASEIAKAPDPHPICLPYTRMPLPSISRQSDAPSPSCRQYTSDARLNGQCESLQQDLINAIRSACDDKTASRFQTTYIFQSDINISSTMADIFNP